LNSTEQLAYSQSQSQSQTRIAPAFAQTQLQEPQPSAATYLTEFLANSVSAPPRDNYALYAGLKSHNPNDKNLAHTHPHTHYNSGDKDQFWVFNLQTKQFHQITATCVAVTPHVYMFLDDAYHEDTAALKQMSTIFEDKIYQTDHQYFGSEWTPGVDEDPHLVILNTPLAIALGYFSASDELVQPINPYSNEREMFYIAVPPNSNFYLSTLAHEFQHMIEFHTRYNQFAWINEASSVWAQTINGFSSSGAEQAFFSRPDTQLGSWTCGGCGTSRYYGVGFTFISYLADHYGPNVVKDLTGGGPNVLGLNAVDYALAQNKHPELDNKAIFGEWVTTNLLNQHTADPHYNYKTLNGSVSPKAINNLPTQLDNLSTPQYSASYYSITNAPNGFNLNFQGQPTVALAGTNAHSGKMAWWGNRGDNSDNTLTHDFDLSKVSKATLNFWTWFDTEANFDYVYIEASTDGGATWDILPGKYTNDNSNTGQSYGAGLTGRSNPDQTDLTDGDNNKAVWVQEHIDLSKYAGKQIKLRFEYITDDAYNKQGVLLDDLEIPEIGFKDDMESGENGWQAAGFILVNDLLPQHFVIRVISQDDTCWQIATTDLEAAKCIVELTPNSSNQLNQHLPFHKAFVIVAPYAIKTLLPATFSLSFN
jgi:hypothetical protein